MVASKQQQRVALVLLITCLDNKRKNEDDVCGASHGWAKKTLWTSSSNCYSANLRVILLFEFKHPISLQAASF